MALSRDDWIDASLEALDRDGFPGVAVEPLARRLGASKGSFYWHFRSRPDLVRATLDLWERRDTDEVIDEVRAVSGGPESRLDALVRRALGGSDGFGCEAAVLAGANDPLVAVVLDRVTAKRVAFLTELYADLGLDPVRAARRARITYALYLGIGELRRTEARRGHELEADEIEELVHDTARLLIGE